MFTFDEQTVSDLHKNARNYRPVATWWEMWNSSSNEEKQIIWDDLILESEFEAAQDKLREEMAIRDFNRKINSIMDAGAPDHDTAIRWFVESLGLSDIDKQYGGEYICYLLGLPYSMEATFDVYFDSKLV